METYISIFRNFCFYSPYSSIFLLPPRPRPPYSHTHICSPHILSSTTSNDHPFDYSALAIIFPYFNTEWKFSPILSVREFVCIFFYWILGNSFSIWRMRKKITSISNSLKEWKNSAPTNKSAEKSNSHNVIKKYCVRLAMCFYIIWFRFVLMRKWNNKRDYVQM